MTLITRLGRLFRADLNAVLDGLEEPAMLLRQAVRDMEQVLAEEEGEHARLAEEGRRLAQAVDEHHARLAALDEELTLCLAADKDELARDLVRRKLEASRHGTLLTERQQALGEAHKRLAQRIAEHRQRLDTLRAQAVMHDSVSATGGESPASAWPVTAAISDAEIEVALLRERQREGAVMKRLAFPDALLFAAALSAAGTVLAHVLSPLLGVALISRGLCSLLALAYVLFLLLRSRIKRGRVSLLAAWMMAALAIALLCPSLLSMAAAHLTLIWLTRALLFHASLLTALADLAVTALSLAAGCWALIETGSLFASLWSLCLVQACCALLPLRRESAGARAADQRFSHAARAADEALRALTSSR